jgi:hypothetical protein
VDEAPFEPLDALGRTAQAGARELTAAASTALLGLAGVDDACAIAGCSEALARAARRRASARRGAAVEAALAPIGDALEEASARVHATPGDDPRIAVLARASAVWKWAGEDETVERFVVDRAQPVGWDAYRGTGWSQLRKLITAVDPMVERLAGRIEQTANIAYASGCAELLVFRAQIESPFRRQKETAERALRLCPSHRNARVVLAGFLCEEAILRVTVGLLPPSRADCAAAEADVARAEELFPTSSRIAGARAKIEAAKRRALS